MQSERCSEAFGLGLYMVPSSCLLYGLKRVRGGFTVSGFEIQGLGVQVVLAEGLIT